MVRLENSKMGDNDLIPGLVFEQELTTEREREFGIRRQLVRDKRSGLMLAAPGVCMCLPTLKIRSGGRSSRTDRKSFPDSPSLTCLGRWRLDGLMLGRSDVISDKHETYGFQGSRRRRACRR